MNSITARIIYVVFMRIVMTVSVVGASFYVYRHPNVLNQTGRDLAQRIMPASRDVPDVNGPSPTGHR